MDIPRQQLLKRWESLQDGTGLVRSAKLARLLSASGFLLVLLVTCAVAYRLSPIFVAAASAVTGWVIAERNALQLRVSQWPIFSEYIDWDRVRRDSRSRRPDG
jgi:hypothetical protein